MDEFDMDGSIPGVKPAGAKKQQSGMDLDTDGSFNGKRPVIGIIDRYEITRPLGKGAFGEVYQGWDTVSRLPIAIKMIPAEVGADHEEMEEIRYNFGLTSKLYHPNIVSLLHLHPVDNTDQRARELGFKKSDFLIIMEYAPGETLFAWRRRQPNRVLSLDKALSCCAKIAEAIDYAHSQNIIHRDIKPKNVMVTRQSTTGNHPSEMSIKVLDFGLGG